MSNNSPHQPRQKFIADMKELSKQFAEAKENVQNREILLNNALDRLTNSLTQTVGGVAEKKLAQNNLLAQAARNTDKKIAARLTAWKNRVKQYDRNIEFRKDYGDSLLIYIYGKVKAGKSSLGNYVAYGHGDPDQDIIRAAHKNGLQPTFFMKDAANSAEIGKKVSDLRKLGKFCVGAKETTTEIQGFRFPGLTWIDSPGLHSVKPENGELSKSYADAADLILYPMNSGQPGRASDLAEIASLLKVRKPFVVVISRCDTVDIDYDDNGNEIKTRLMKTPKDRQDQIDYVRKEILAKAEKESRDLLDADVITISVSFAQEYGDDPARLCESGMTDFFKKLTKITQSQGLKLKKNVPLNNLRAFVDLLLDGELSIAELLEDLLNLKESIKIQRTSLKNKQKKVIGGVLRELDSAIEQEVLLHKSSRDTAALANSCTKIIQNVAVRHTMEALEEILRDTQSSIDAAIRLDEFENFPEFKDVTKNITLSNEAKGRAIGGGLGAALFGIGAALLTGGASLVITASATTIAATLGGMAGAKAGESMAGENVKTIHIGDNSREVINEATRIAGELAQSAVEKAFIKFDHDFLTPVENRCSCIIDELELFKVTLKEKVLPQ